MTCARELAGNENFLVTVIDRHSYQLFSPLLYQVATGGLPEDDIAYPVRAAVPEATFVRAAVSSVDTKTRTVKLNTGAEIDYDCLVLGTGSVGTTFSVPGAVDNALQMKDIYQARAIKNQLLGMYETVAAGQAPAEHLKVVVVGAGPTGVEVAGAVAELQKQMAREFGDIAHHANVTLVEAGERILPTFTSASSDSALRALNSLGVEVIVDAPVESIEKTAVLLPGREPLTSGTTIWSAGVCASPDFTYLGETDRANRLVVDEYLKLSDTMWVVGDAAQVKDSEGKPLPMVASVAMQQGRYVAQCLLNPDKAEPFRYRNKGQMATIGRRMAVVELPNGLRLEGTLAWLAWLALHVFYLAGGRNRVSVLADWFWNYLAWNSGPRRTVLD